MEKLDRSTHGRIIEAVHDAIRKRGLAEAIADGHAEAVARVEDDLVQQFKGLQQPAVRALVVAEVARFQENRRLLWQRWVGARAQSVHAPSAHQAPVAPTLGDHGLDLDEDTEIPQRWTSEAAVTKTILVAVDGSLPSLRAVDLAASMARALGAAIDLVSVVATPADKRVSSHFRAGMHDEARKESLARAQERIDDPDLEVFTRVLHGPPTTVLLHEAGMPGVAIVVVGRRGRGDEQGATPGSISQAIAAHARVPVLVVP
jgi:nucleotide-binding universal stress UspA family protein